VSFVDDPGKDVVSVLLLPDLVHADKQKIRQERKNLAMEQNFMIVGM
jgi:hypothetical protein